jgi:8-oxo-dGTP diphosphatase
MRPKQKTVRVADVIANYRGKLVLIERLHPPFGLAFPGGHVDPGETAKQAAIREFTEETGYVLTKVKFLTKRSGKHRDPRYSMSATRVYTGEAVGKRRDEKGFTKVRLMDPEKAREQISKKRFAFDHGSILEKYFKKKA